MSLSLSTQAYSSLNEYALLASTAMTATAATTITNGVYGSVTDTTDTDFVGTASNGNAATTAQTQLIAFLDNFSLVANTLQIVNLTSPQNNFTFQPNTNYKGPVGGINFTGTVTFDGLGNSNNQFFLDAPSVTFQVSRQ